MPTFSGNNVDLNINRLDTKKLDYAIEKKKYNAFKNEIVGVYDAKAFMMHKLKLNRQDSIRSTVSSKPNAVVISKCFDIFYGT